MNLRSRQLGLGWFGLLFVLGTIAFVAILVIKVGPMYLNQMKVASSVYKVATDSENGTAEIGQLRKDLQRYWDIEDIKYLEPREINVKRTSDGRYLSYEYEATEHLFYNISVLLDFAGEVKLTNSN